jgi:hypothetical protein
MAGKGIRWTTWAAACVALTACGGGSGGGSSGSGGGNFTTSAVSNPTDGSEGALDATDPDKVLAAGLAVIATTNGIQTLGIGGFDNGAAPAPAKTEDCGAGTVTTEISESGSERTFTRGFDQCYFNSSPDFLFDGRFSQISTSVGSNIAGSLEVGQGPTPGVFVIDDGSGLSSVQILSTGGALQFSGSSSGSPFHVQLNNAAMVAAKGDRPSEGGVYAPNRGFKLLIGTDAEFDLDSQDSGANVAQEFSGTLSFRASGLNSVCNFNASVGVASGTGADAILLDSSGHAVGGAMDLTGTGGTASIAFLANGDALVTTSAGTDVPYTAAQIQALCDF